MLLNYYFAKKHLVEVRGLMSTFYLWLLLKDTHQKKCMLWWWEIS